MASDMERMMPRRFAIVASASSSIFGLIQPHDSPLRPLAAGERALGRFILPDFQRPAVWTEGQKVRLIESIYMGLPIGALVWNQTRWGNECDGWLLDGQQRMTAILSYVSGDFPVHGWRYPDLPENEQRHFKRIGIAVVEMGIEDRATCLEVYDRLVYGGTQHEPKKASVSEQEARDAG